VSPAVRLRPPFLAFLPSSAYDGQVPNTSKSVVLLAPAFAPHSPCATAFFVTGPSNDTFLVTAGHALTPFLTRSGHALPASPLVAICNPPQGPSHSMRLPANWFGHPNTDIAVLPCKPWPHLDLVALPFVSLQAGLCSSLPQPSRLLGPSLTSTILRLGYAKRRFNPTTREGALLRVAYDLSNAPSFPQPFIPEAYLATFASAPGHSGAPVLTLPDEGLSLLGLLIGCLNGEDRSPAIIIPALRIREAILEATACLASSAIPPSACQSIREPFRPRRAGTNRYEIERS
jgi:hypothetical protein